VLYYLLAELEGTLCDHFSLAGNDLKRLVFNLNDGGPEHKLSNDSVKASHLCLFVGEDLVDGLFCVNSCPLNSWTNEVERFMAFFNFGLYGVSCTCSPLTDDMYEKTAPNASNTESDMRAAIAKNPDFVKAMSTSIKEVTDDLQERLIECKMSPGVNIKKGFTASADDLKRLCLRLNRIDPGLPDWVMRSRRGPR